MSLLTGDFSVLSCESLQGTFIHTCLYQAMDTDQSMPDLRVTYPKLLSMTDMHVRWDRKQAASC